MDAEHPAAPWLWGDRHGALSCGASACSLPRREYHPLSPIELAELGALAKAHRTTLRCRCGAVEYDPESRTVRERNERNEP